ncbi:uncharacterized protein E0L32_007662 [Thyridium curvatum]|uniref:Transcription initiation factor TFIID subunit 10 n=1 Tax=Thyridium curvatum TaxID=1093900 RepID=A0A507AVE7_9PEZI|nr:uncharacterized protein E0L32_007662 [Thyridium curvatum]TPX11683.1 hypothetical protein E0L32_007662 [Thyridium curvatum]
MASIPPTENPAAAAAGSAADQAPAPSDVAAPAGDVASSQQTNGAPATQQQATAAPAVAPADDAQPSLPDSRPVTRKDTSLKDFLNKMDDYAPIIPDAVTNYYMTKAGLPPPPQTDQRLARLLALATQKFVADIAADAYQYSRIRGGNTSSGSNPMGSLGAAAGVPAGGAAAAGGSKDAAAGGKGGQPLGVQRPGYGGGGQGGGQNRTVLTMEDLGMAAGEYGVNVKRSEFYR